jgi:hypothetical protein
LLTLVLVFGGLCYGGYLVVKANTTDPLTEELTITIDDLGARQALRVDWGTTSASAQFRIRK